MRHKLLETILFVSLPEAASVANLIACDSLAKNERSTKGIWPVTHPSGNKLCFNMKSQSGSTSVRKRLTATWFSEAVIFSIDGGSQGRDDTWFKVTKPVLTENVIEYTIEASRAETSWDAISHASINRTSGQAANWFIKEHGSTSHDCHLEGKKL